MANYTNEEVIVCEIARWFGPKDDLVVFASSNSGLVGLSLVKELYAPRLSIFMNAKGKGAFLRDVRLPFANGMPPEESIETLVNMKDVLNFVVRGKWCVVTQPVQIDQYGNSNLSLVGDKDKPSAVFVGSRALPDNTVNAPRNLYFVPNHIKRVFMDRVDFISGVGYGKERKEGIIKWGIPDRIVTNLCVLDFDEKSGKMRLESIHAGITLDQVKENTGFDLIIPDSPQETTAPSREELHWIRDVIDPLGVRRLDFLKGDNLRKVYSEIMEGVPYQPADSKK